jgi:hypothetical protein
MGRSVIAAPRAADDSAHDDAVAECDPELHEQRAPLGAPAWLAEAVAPGVCALHGPPLAAVEQSPELDWQRHEVDVRLEWTSRADRARLSASTCWVRIGLGRRARRAVGTGSGRPCGQRQEEA